MNFREEAGGIKPPASRVSTANQILARTRGLRISSEEADGVARVSERFEVVPGDREPRLKRMSGKINALQMLSDAITGSRGSPGTSSGLPPFLEGVDHTEWIRKPTARKAYDDDLNETLTLTSYDLFGGAHEAHKHTIYRIDPVILESAFKRLQEMCMVALGKDKDDKLKLRVFFVLDRAVTEAMELKGKCNLRKLLGDREPDKVPIIHYSWSGKAEKFGSAHRELSHLAARAFCFTQEDGLPPFGEHIIS